MGCIFLLDGVIWLKTWGRVGAIKKKKKKKKKIHKRFCEQI
jgi:hypothetical protein